MADQLITGTTLVESTSRSNGDVPIGGIIPWLKSMTGVYNVSEGWVECNGQTLNDSLSSLNGQVIPDLNGENRFLRGNSTSGDTGGSETHQHTTPFAESVGGNEFGLSTDRESTTKSPTPKLNWIKTATEDEYTYIRPVDSTVASTTLFIKTEEENAVPPYYNVVWVMRVR